MIAIETQGKKDTGKLPKKVSSPPLPGGASAPSGLCIGRKKRDPVLNAWGSYLDGLEWQLFTTLTTGRELTLPGARRSINKLAGYLKQNGYPAEIFWAAEPFDLKEGYHLHSLVRFTDLAVGDDNKLAYDYLVSGWRQVTGEKSARIFSERYKPEKGANHYLAKYMTKTRSDYDFIHPHKNENKDQFEDSNVYGEAVAQLIAKRQDEAKKERWRQFQVKQLAEKGIFAGKHIDKAEYTTPGVTLDSWIYEQEKTGYHSVITFPNYSGTPRFTALHKQPEGN